MSHSSEGALDTDGRVDTPSSLFGIGLLSAALMATEIALTRVLSVTIWYHFAFFAISVALLGTGLAALLVHALQARLFARGWRAWCGLFSLLQALSTLLVTLGLARVSPDWFGGMSGAFTLFTWKLSLVFGLAVLPFACGGMVIATVTARAGSAMHRVYFVDLVGAALGCLITIPLLSWLGGPNALVACAGMATLAALVFAWPVSSERARRARGMLGAGACVLVLLELVCAGSSATELRSAKGVDLTRVKPELTRWNSSSLVNVFGEQGFRGWGLSPRFTGTLPAQKTLIIDMSALTPITRFDGDFSRVDYVRYDLSSLVYRVFPVRERAAEVCVVGAGGGKDVLSALAAGSKHVTGVEINPLIVNDVMRGAYRTFSGGLYDRPDVDIVEGDGRGFLRGTQRKFDVILISMVDTSAATAAGAYALTENGLYTREAFEEFLARLRPGGVLTVSTVSLPGLAVGARLAATARAAVLARGGKPNESVAVAHTPWVTRSDSELYDLLIKPDGFSSDELERFMHSLIELDFAPGFVPRRSFASPRAEDRLVDAILRARSDAELERTLRAYPLDATAVSDDRPFFFYQNRFSDFVDALLLSDTQHLFGNGLRVLAKVLVLAFVMLLACAVLPLVWLRSGRALQADLAYAACLGVGFMCIEIALVHRVTLFLGQPTYTLVAVLFVLLCAGGLGSRWLAPRLSIWGSRAALVFVVIAAAAALLPAVSDALFFAMRSAALPVRACVAAVAIAPVGWLLGAPLPAGFARVSTVDDSRVAWLWGVNGAASVFGSILATLTALHAGTRITLWVGAAAYLLAALLWRRLWR